MSESGFVKVPDCFPLMDCAEIYSDILNDLMNRGFIKTTLIHTGNIRGVKWELNSPEIERLSKRVAELENTNSRLYRLITDEANRREARRML